MTLDEILKKMRQERREGISINNQNSELINGINKARAQRENNSKIPIAKESNVSNRSTMFDNMKQIASQKDKSWLDKYKEIYKYTNTGDLGNSSLNNTRNALNSLGFGLVENIATPLAKATLKTVDNYSARKKALDEKDPNMSWLKKYIEIKKDTEADNINNLLNYASKKSEEYSNNDILSSILLGSNKNINNEKARKNVFMGGIVPSNFQLKDNIDEREYKKYTNEELQSALNNTADEIAPNKVARQIGNIGYEGVKMGASVLFPEFTPLIYGTTGAVEEYGRTDDPDKIIASGAKDMLYGSIMRGTSGIAKKGLTKVVPGVSEKILPTVATNFGANYIGGASASALTDVGYDLITGEKIDPKQIAKDANKSGLMSGIIGGVSDTVRDVKLSKLKLDKDINNTVEKLQNINKQITEGDVSISKNPKIVNKLLEKGQKEIESLSNNNYLMQNKKLKEAIEMLQKAYDTGHINEINVANNNLVGLLGTAEMNLKATQQNEIQLKNDIKNFSMQIDNIEKITENNSIKVLSNTPKVYQDLGLNNLPMTITKNHTLWSMEKKDGNTHKHGIEKEILKQIPDALTRPLNVVKSGSRSDSIVAITELSDSEGNLIIVPVKVDGKTNFNEIEIDANVLTSMYGKDKDYDGWMKRNQEMGRILYDKDDGIIKKYRDNPPRLQLPNDTISTINNIIPRGENYVNRDKKKQKKTNDDINSFIKRKDDTVQISEDKEKRLLELKSIDTSKMGLIEKTNIKREIRALEAGYTNVEDYQKSEKLKSEQVKLDYEEKQRLKEINKLTEISGQLDTKYQMQHRPTKNGVGYDITSTDSIGKDIYTNPENYVDMSFKYNQESYKSLLDIKDNPNAEVTIYRASPRNELNEGDWITLSKTYAEMEAQKENVPVNEFKVKAKDIQFAGDDINEFGYFPQESNIVPIKEKTSTAMPIMEAYRINEFNGYANKENIKPLIERLKGDKLLDTQDFIKEIKSVGAEVDDNGYVRVYHRTSKENLDNIYKSGKMSAKEDGIFFSTSKNGYNNSNYGDSVLELKIPAEKLQLDDIFNDEASVKIPLKNKKQVMDVSEYIIDNKYKKIPIPIDKKIQLTNNKVMNYNNNESIGEVNGRQGENNSRSIRKIEEHNKQGRSESNFTNSKRESINSRYGEDDFSQKTIGKALTDIDAKKSVINYAKSNQIVELNSELSKLKKDAQELGINLVLFSGEKGNEYIGLMQKDNMYLDVNKDNSSIEDGSIYDRFYHEVFHYLKRNTSFYNQIKEIQSNILKNSEEIINKYIEKKGYSINDFPEEIRGVITEEILADYCAKHMSGYNINYDLPEDVVYLLNQTVEDAIIELKLNKKHLNKEDSPEINNFIKKQDENIPINKNKNDEYISPTIDKISEKRSEKNIKVSDVKDLLVQKIVNKGHTVDKLAKATNNPNLTYAYDRTLSAFAEGNYSIGVAQTNNKGEEIGKSIKEIFKPVEEKKIFKEFNDYLLNRHNIDRMAVEKTVFNENITPQKSKETIKNYEDKYPEFKELAKDVYKFNKNELQNLVDAGIVDKNTQEYLTELYGDYVPTIRDITETAKVLDEKTTGAKNPIKSAKGGTNSILNIKDAMAEQVIRNKKTIRMNELGLELAKSLGEKSVVDPNVEITYSAEAIMSLGGNVVTYEGDKPIFTVFKNGQVKELVIGDDLYDSLKKDTIISKIQNSKLNVVAEPVAKITNAYKDLLTTYSIGFAFNNTLKDMQDATFNTKYNTFTFAKNYTRALYQIATKGEYHKKYLANGGSMNSYFEYGNGVKKDTKNPIKKFVQKVQTLNEVLEEAPRLAEFISTLEKGGTISEAMYNSADITTNFKRGGEVSKALNKYGANFLNASIQGLDKAYRTFKGEKGWKGYARLLMKAGLFAVMPSVLNHLLLRDDKDYQALPSYIKDEYYLFKKDNGKFLRIPKGRIISIMGSTARRVIEVTGGKEFDFKGLKDTVKKQLAPNNPFEDNIFAPIKAVTTNKAWYGGEIVPTRLQKQLPKNQYDEKTDEISKWLGGIFNYSPKKINYLLDQYSGGIGDVILPMLTPQAENNILEDKFTTDSVLKNKYVGEFYDKKDELEKINNDISKTYQDEVKYKYLNNVSEKIGKLYNQKREVQMSNISDNEKKETVRDIQKEINWYAENALKNIEGDMTEEQEWNMYIEGIFSNTIRSSDNSSNSLDAQYAVDNNLCTSKEYIELYRKAKENKQSMPTIKYLEKMQETGLKLENYVNYKINTKDFESDKDTNGKTIKSSLNEKEAIAIMKMDISDDQKNLLFDIINKTDDKPNVSDLKKLNGNYLTYLQQSGKKNDDGISQRDKYMMYIDAGIPTKTLNKYYSEIGKIEGAKDSNGKTISGSKKNAIFNYINSLPLSATQKKILFTKTNSSYGKSYKREIFNYINSLPISKTRKEQIWKELYD